MATLVRSDAYCAGLGQAVETLVLEIQDRNRKRNRNYLFDTTNETIDIIN